MSALELYVLGLPRLVREGVDLALDSRKNLALITYLAMTGQSHSRETLITLLWPDSEPSRGRAGLRRDLSVIKKALDGEWLVVDREIIGCDPDADLWLDVVQFRGLIRAWQDHGHPEEEVCPDCLFALTEAVELYQGDFMAGFSLRDSANFDEWQFFQTEGLRRELAWALERLARGYGAGGAYETAILHARRWVALDSLNELAQRQLMELYGRADQRSAALRQYKECTRVLEEELGLSPSEETTALFEKLRTRGTGRGSRPPHNFPAQVTPFVGREEELGEIQARLSGPDCRLLTLVGAGGIGKTRLALRAAELALNARADDFEHGVFYVRLGPLRSAENIVPAVAEALGFRFHERGGPRQQLLAYLRGRRLLLVMDNFEHLLEGVELVTEILRSAPEVKLLVTSRIRLSLRGEHLFPVEGMDVPDADVGAKALGFSAVKLFVQGARRTLAGPDWDPGPEALRDVISVCRLVGGMPLGILLAAAWVEMLSPAEISAEIGRGLDFLETDLQDVPPRQRSLRAVFDHSWRLLSERERSLMPSLSVFRGGLTGEAAREVAGASLREQRALLSKGFLERGGDRRYEVHDLLRGYTAEKLNDSPDGGLAARDRHCAYFCQALQAWEADLKGPRQQTAMAEIGTDIENARAAWDWAVERGQVRRLDEAIHGLGHFYQWHGRYREGEAAFRLASKQLEATPSGDSPISLAPSAVEGSTVERLRVLAKVLAWRAVFNDRQGHTELASQLLGKGLAILGGPELVDQETRPEKAFVLQQMGFISSDLEEARRLFEQSLAIYRALDDQWGAAGVLRNLGWVARHSGVYGEARQLWQKGLAIRREMGDQEGIARSLWFLGSLALRQGQDEEGERLMRESAAMRRELGSRPGIASGLSGVGDALMRRGKYSESHSLLDESVAIRDDLQDREYVASRRLLPVAKVHLGQYEGVRARGLESLTYYREIGLARGIGYSLVTLGMVALAMNAHTEAWEILQEMLTVFLAVGDREGAMHAHAFLGYANRGMGDLRRAEEHLSAALRAATEIGAFGSFRDVLPAVALLLADQGEKERAVELYALASRYPYVAESRWFGDVVGRHIAAVAAALPPEVVEAARERGRARDLNATIAELLAELTE